MTPEDFSAKWRGSTRTERSASQEHFLDLCELLGVKKPQEVDPHGAFYTFEKSVLKPDGRQGRADVWRKDCFAWEYKGPRKNLTQAYSQLKEYADGLLNPPLLIVSDMAEIRIHTNFTNAVSVTHVIKLADLTSVEARQKLRDCFENPEKLRPAATRETVTRDAAKAFGAIAARLRSHGADPRRVAHFLNRLVFCLFVEDVGLIPDRIFADILEEAAKEPGKFEPMLQGLFRAMKDKGGLWGTHSIPWFNGGLFDDDDVLPLGLLEIKDLVAASLLDWSAIEPSIFGTLFEAGLDPQKREIMASLFDPAAPAKARRGQPVDRGVGIHYTDPATIMKIVEPVVLAPLRREWEAAKAEIAALRAKRDRAKSDGARTRAENEARSAWLKFRARLGRYRVLDPACGSGNFLYLALLHLKNFDEAVLAEGRALGLPPDNQRIGVDTLLGIEINPYAAELARVTIWIGELQWQLRNSMGITRSPILGRLDGIECRDALLNPDGTEAEWPSADAVVGNPPFLGGKRLLAILGESYVRTLRATFQGRLPDFTDLVCYWFEKARLALKAQMAKMVGFVATNSIRSGTNRTVLERIASEFRIFEAWSDEPWVVDGAAVRVSIVCYALSGDLQRLDGLRVERINSDLTATFVDLTRAERLFSNNSVAFIGIQKTGSFDIPGDIARQWLLMPINPNGRPNSDVLKPYINGNDLTHRSRDVWIIDAGDLRTEDEVALYEAPYSYLKKVVFPQRLENKEELARSLWWVFWRLRPELRASARKMDRVMVTPRVAKHRLFVWLDKCMLADSRLVAITRDDDASFGILHSRFHEAWSLHTCSWHGVGNDPTYNAESVFNTFPFPAGLTPNIPAADYAGDPRAQAIAAAAKRLDELRNAWLNPPDLVKIVPEVAPGFPDRVLPKDDKAAAILKKRTLTNLYNERPTWLANAHRDLDAAVAAAYGWPADISEDDALAALLALNRERAAAQGG
jgi:type II restriction/modification system DNA methylase subunit YeeA